jgi:serine phosphatase RsbU (regulator of sigma subunit)/TPR repeat protein
MDSICLVNLKKKLSKNEKKFFYKSRAMVLNNLGIISQESGDNKKALEYYDKSMEMQKKVGNKKGVAAALNNIGLVYDDYGNFSKAKLYFEESLKIRMELGDTSEYPVLLLNIGRMEKQFGNYSNAIKYYMNALKILESRNDSLGMPMVFQDLCDLYVIREEYNTALEYLKKSLKIYQLYNSKRDVANTYNNLGIIYGEMANENRILCKCDDDKGMYDLASNHFMEGLKSWQELQDKPGIGNSLSGLGSIAQNRKDYKKALEYFNESLIINEEKGDIVGIVSGLINVGSVHLELGNFVLARTHLERAMSLAKECKSVELQRMSAASLWKAYRAVGDLQASLDTYVMYIEMRDSINSEENQKELIRQEYKYAYEKEAATDSIKNAEAEKIADAEIAARDAQIEHEATQRFALYGGLSILLVFAAFMYNRYRVTNKQKRIIEQKERETNMQKELIEEKHKEITDSINYAERIQRSFLATRQILDENLRDYFVFFRPKDIVSGDFYWAAQLKNGNFAFSVADSTGHGVPGAIMSILNISSLEKSIENQTEPHKILFETRKIIINRLKNDGSVEGGKDGMDCSLLVFNQDKSELTFASANNPVIIIRDKEILEYRGDKLPVGKHDKDQDSFTLHTLSLKKNDMIYALTDGFPDQFGGPKGKKFMIKSLKELFLTIAHLPVKEQEQQIAREFENWKGTHEQVDDVCVIGVRI